MSGSSCSSMCVKVISSYKWPQPFNILNGKHVTLQCLWFSLIGEHSCFICVWTENNIFYSIKTSTLPHFFCLISLLFVCLCACVRVCVCIFEHNWMRNNHNAINWLRVVILLFQSKFITLLTHYMRPEIKFW